MSLPSSSLSALNKLIVKGGTKVSLNDRFSRLQRVDKDNNGLRGSAVPQAPQPTRVRRAATAAPSYAYRPAPAAALRRPAQPMFTPTPLRGEYSANVQLTGGLEDDLDEWEDEEEIPRYQQSGQPGFLHRSASDANLRLSGYSQSASRQRTLHAAFQIKKRLGVHSRLGEINKRRHNGYAARPFHSRGAGYGQQSFEGYGGRGRGYTRSFGGYVNNSGWNNGGMQGRGGGGHWRGGNRQRGFYYPRGRGRRMNRGAGRGHHQGPKKTREELDKEIDAYMADSRSTLDKDLDSYMNDKQTE